MPIDVQDSVSFSGLISAGISLAANFRIDASAWRHISANLMVISPEDAAGLTRVTNSNDLSNVAKAVAEIWGHGAAMHQVHYLGLFPAFRSSNALDKVAIAMACAFIWRRLILALKDQDLPCGLARFAPTVSPTVADISSVNFSLGWRSNLLQTNLEYVERIAAFIGQELKMDSAEAVFRHLVQPDVPVVFVSRACGSGKSLGWAGLATLLKLIARGSGPVPVVIVGVPFVGLANELLRSWATCTAFSGFLKSHDLSSIKAALWSGGADGSLSGADPDDDAGLIFATMDAMATQRFARWLGENHGRVFCVCLDEAQELAESFSFRHKVFSVVLHRLRIDGMRYAALSGSIPRWFANVFFTSSVLRPWRTLIGDNRLTEMTLLPFTPGSAFKNNIALSVRPYTASLAAFHEDLRKCLHAFFSPSRVEAGFTAVVFVPSKNFASATTKALESFLELNRLGKLRRDIHKIVCITKDTPKVLSDFAKQVRPDTVMRIGVCTTIAATGFTYLPAQFAACTGAYSLSLLFQSLQRVGRDPEVKEKAYGILLENKQANHASRCGAAGSVDRRRSVAAALRFIEHSGQDVRAIAVPLAGADGVDTFAKLNICRQVAAIRLQECEDLAGMTRTTLNAHEEACGICDNCDADFNILFEGNENEEEGSDDDRDLHAPVVGILPEPCGDAGHVPDEQPTFEPVQYRRIHNFFRLMHKGCHFDDNNQHAKNGCDGAGIVCPRGLPWSYGSPHCVMCDRVRSQHTNDTFNVYSKCCTIPISNGFCGHCFLTAERAINVGNTVFGDQATTFAEHRTQCHSRLRKAITTHPRKHPAFRRRDPVRGYLLACLRAYGSKMEIDVEMFFKLIVEHNRAWQLINYFAPLITRRPHVSSMQTILENNFKAILQQEDPHPEL
jgi:hypothetical protein